MEWGNKPLAKEFQKLVDFFSDEITTMLLDHMGDEKFPDQQALYDGVCDLLTGIDLTAEVKERIKKNLDAK